MNAASPNTADDWIRQKLAPFPAHFQELIWAFRRERSPALLENIVRGMLEYHAGEAFRINYPLKCEEVLLVEDLGFDSLALIELSFQAEEFTAVVIQIEDFARIRTLRDLQACVREKAFPAGIVN